jgi:hypothetical protein
MSAWTNFATQFFHNKQKQNPEYKFSQALKDASKVYKKTKGGSSKKQRGGDDPKATGVESPATGLQPPATDAVEKKKYSFNEDATDFSEDSKGNLDLENLHNMIELSTGDSVNAMKKKFNELDGVTDEMKLVLDDEVITNPNDTEDKTLSIGGKKSKRKSKKAGKKSQKKQKKAKKAKKAGSKKSKK